MKSLKGNNRNKNVSEESIKKKKKNSNGKEKTLFCTGLVIYL
jgi:hypothetical protein